MYNKHYHIFEYKKNLDIDLRSDVTWLKSRRSFPRSSIIYTCNGTRKSAHVHVFTFRIHADSHARFLSLLSFRINTN